MTPKEDFKQICDLTTSLLGFPKGKLSSKSRSQALQRARNIASVIGRKEGIKREIIAKGIKRDRTAIYHYEKQHKHWLNNKSYPSYAKSYTKVLAAYEEIEKSRKQFIDKFHLRHYVKELGLKNCEKKDIVFTIISGAVSVQLFSDAHNFSNYYDTLTTGFRGYRVNVNYCQYEDYKKLY